MATTTSPLEVIRTAVAATVEKVYIEPIRQDGLIVIPAASVGGGGGGGGGGSAEPDRPGSGAGEGGGFGLRAKPAGAFVIKQGKVRWQPAVDVNRLVLGAQVVAVTALLAARAVILGIARSAQSGAEPRAAGPSPRRTSGARLFRPSRQPKALHAAAARQRHRRAR